MAERREKRMMKKTRLSLGSPHNYYKPFTPAVNEKIAPLLFRHHDLDPNGFLCPPPSMVYCLSSTSGVSLACLLLLLPVPDASQRPPCVCFLPPWIGVEN